MPDSLSQEPADARGTERRTDRLGASHWGKIVVLVAAFTLFVGACTPSGTKSGQYPEALVFTLGGAIGVHLVFFSLWAGLGSAPWFCRIPISVLACALVFGANAFGGWRRTGSPIFLADLVVGPLVLFSLYTLILLLVRRRWGWRIVHCGVSARHRRPRKYRFQFGLRLLLLWVTLAACVMALYRFHFPDGGAVEIVLQWWERFGRRNLLYVPFHTALLLPTFVVPWVTLAHNRPGKPAILVIVMAWEAYSLGLASVMTYWMQLGPQWVNIRWVVSVHFGASLAGVLVALALRSWGYRIVRLANSETVWPVTTAA